MLQLNNQTPFKASMGLFPNEDGVDCAYGLLKATFAVTSKGVEPAEEQQPVILCDQPWDDEKPSSIKRAAEMGLIKPSTDILVHGHAFPAPRDRRRGEILIRVGQVAKSVAVFGDRRWESAALGWSASPPLPFEKIPLKYELAFGGTDLQPKDAQKIDYEPRNPVGRGLIPKGSEAAGEGALLPNFEDPAHLIRGPRDRPAPVGFGPVSAHWEPRKSFAGTYDADWQKKRAPYLPKDFNPRFHQVAPPDLIAPSYLQGGERVELTGVTTDGPWSFDLPRTKVEMVFHFDGKECPYKANLDTLCFEPDQQLFTMVWRACHAVDKHPHRLKELEIRCPEFPAKKGSA